MAKPLKTFSFPKEDFSPKKQKSSWLQECVTELKTRGPSPIFEANKLSLMEENKLKTNELHAFLSNGVSASCRGTLKEGNFSVLLL